MTITLGSHVQLNRRFTPDPFIIGLVAAVALASILPCRGRGADIFGVITYAAIALLFFLHGAKLPREAILAGLGHWRLHLTVLVSTFVLFPLIGLLVRFACRNFIATPLLDGIVFLCVLPSTVQSSIAFTSIARGNVPAAVCSASASNLLGMVVTPVLVGLLLASETLHSTRNGPSLHAMSEIALELLAPFIIGHLTRPLLIGLLARYKSVVGLVDRGSILLVVYTAFSAAIVEGLWHRISVGDLVLVALLDGIVLGVALATTSFAARRLGFSREDEIVIVFCGSKKSLASGVPMAGVLFPAANIGALIVPLMLFHQMQLMVCAMLARRYAARAAILAAPERTPDQAARDRIII